MNGASKKRRRHVAAQNSICHYCRRKMNEGVRQIKPVLEHFEPRSSPFRPKVTVAACAWCDKAKGMMPGDIFVALIEVETCGRSFGAAMQDISREAKSINYRLHRAHETKMIASLVRAGSRIERERAAL